MGNSVRKIMIAFCPNLLDVFSLNGRKHSLRTTLIILQTLTISLTEQETLFWKKISNDLTNFCDMISTVNDFRD